MRGLHRADQRPTVRLESLGDRKMRRIGGDPSVTVKKAGIYMYLATEDPQAQGKKKRTLSKKRGDVDWAPLFPRAWIHPSQLGGGFPFPG